jgi:hypothetical protein
MKKIYPLLVMALVWIATMLPNQAFPQTKYEAENAALTGVSVVTGAANASGGAYVTGLNTTSDKLVFTVNVATAGSYPLVFRYRNSCGACEKWHYIKINSAAEVYTQFAAPAAGWNNKNYGNINLNAGNNTITLRSSWGWTELDYITIGTGDTPPSGPVTIGTNFWRIDWGNGWGDYFVPNVNWSTVANPWRGDFIADLNPYSVLRFMDWGPVNGSQFVNWSDRVPKTANNYNYQVPLLNGDGSTGTGAGVAYEWQIDLCNRATTNMWVNVPHKASDDFVRQLARLIRDNLNSQRKVYIEYSNEVWNWGFHQTVYASEQGEARGFIGEFPFKGKTVYINGWWGYYVYRSCQIARIFEQEFAGQTNRLVKVLGTQLGYNNWPEFVAIWGDIHPPTLQLMAALAQPAINPNHVVFDMYAVAPYWNGNDLTAMQADIANIEDKLGEVQRALNDHGNGIKLICYEGGQDGGNQVANAQNPGIYNVYIDALNRIGARLQGPFVHYTHVGWDGGHAWGAKQNTSATLSASHKYRAIVDWVNAHGGPPARVAISQTPDHSDADKTVTIYPNPVVARTLTAFVNSDRLVNATISLVSVSGQKLAEFKQTLQNGNNIIQVPVGSFKKGMHLLVINKGSERVIKKVMIDQ